MISANVFTSPMYKGCANGGISETHEQVCIVNANGPNKKPHDSEAPVIVVRRDVMGRSILTAYPAIEFSPGVWIKDPRWFMFGGAFIHTSDSRLAELIHTFGMDFHGAIALHDRHEG